MQNKYPIHEASEKLGVQKAFISRCIQYRWIRPAEPHPNLLDEEDLARILLIRELQSEFGANEESIPIILHLLDQLYSIRSYLSKIQRTEL